MPWWMKREERTEKYTVCFEAHYFPDATHHDNFKTTIVKAGDIYRVKAGYKFSVEK